MTKTFKEIISGVRTAVLGIEVREDIAQGMEYVEQFASTAVNKASEAVKAAAEALASKNAAASSASAAKTSETAAASSANAAKTSETNAGASAKNAKTSETAAASSAGAAKTSEANAKTSETNAGTYASNAKNSQTAAAGSASTASSAASTATTKASESASSAASAKSDAAKASASASTAQKAEDSAASSASNAKESETKSAEHLQATKEYFEQVRTITIGAQGWYATPEALKAAVPVGEDGWWAVVGTTDTIWTWDSDTGAWVNTTAKVDLSDYYTRTQVDAKLSTKADKTTAGINALINLLTAGTAAPTDNDYIITQWANHEAADAANQNMYARRPVSALWAYIKAKTDVAYAAKSHTHAYAGSGSAGGSATSAVKLDTTTAGSATQPVYFSGGKPVACTYELKKSVPSNAVFTDHTYAAMKGATASAAGTAGLAPAPAAGAQGKFLRGDGTWQTMTSPSKLDAWPVGSIYQTTGSTSPAALFGGTWEQIASERVLMGASSGHAAGTTAKAGLPNITGEFTNVESVSGGSASGAFTRDRGSDYSGTNDSYSQKYTYTFNAAKSNAIYGASDTVQPAAYYVYIWHRVA